MSIKQEKANQFWELAKKHFIDVSAFDVAFREELIKLGVEYSKVFYPFIFRPTINLNSGLLCSKEIINYFNELEKNFPDSEAIKACKKLYELQFIYNAETDIMQMAKYYKLANIEA
jgi:hypothetical protein